MLEKMDSPQAQVNDTATVRPALASSEPRRLTVDDAERILRGAERRQADWGSPFSDSAEQGPPPRLDVLILDFTDRNSIAPDQADKLLARARAMQDQADARRRDAAMKTLVDAAGSRFAKATLESYRARLPDQRKVLQAVIAYAENIRQRVAVGDGLILFGAAGCGKSHLLVSSAKAAIEAGLSVTWVNGQELFARFRAAIDGEGSESRIIREMAKPDVLVVDDVLPPGGSLTDYQAGTLYRIIDARYRDCRPTWATMNVADGAEAERGMGAQVVDRLRHGATCLFCNWPSHRRATT